METADETVRMRLSKIVSGNPDSVTVFGVPVTELSKPTLILALLHATEERRKFAEMAGRDMKFLTTLEKELQAIVARNRGG